MTMRDELRQLILDRAYEKKKVILASGRESDFYIDLRTITLHPRGLLLTSHLFRELVAAEFPSTKAVGGPTLGADPIVAGVAVVSEQAGSPLAAFIIRKEPKKHGLSKLIEGEKNLSAGMPVVILEDVATSGGSAIKAVDAAREAGLTVLGVAVIVDREEGAAENFAKAGIPFRSLFTRTELIGH